MQQNKNKQCRGEGHK
jgi:hypothetical protein